MSHWEKLDGLFEGAFSSPEQRRLRSEKIRARHDQKMKELVEQGAKIDKAAVEEIIHQFYEEYSNIEGQIGCGISVNVDGIELNPYVAKTITAEDWTYTIFVIYKNINDWPIHKQLPTRYKGLKIKIEYRPIPRLC